MLLWSVSLCVALVLITAGQVWSGKISGSSAAPVIELWYGENQSFGQMGSPQPMISILGNVADEDGIASLSCSLNGGPMKQLTLGCNLHRLAEPGDFNAEIDRRALRDGPNTVELLVVDSAGASSRRTVTVNYTPGRTWPLPYSIDWSRVDNIQDVADIIDGRWSLDSTGVRSVSPYYDRVIGIGDSSWTDYEAILTVTWNKPPLFTDKQGAPYQDHAHASICLRWGGHDNDGRQPLRKWWPLGGLAGLTVRSDSPGKMQWYFWKGDGTRNLISDSTRAFQIGRPYTYRVRVETLKDNQSRYSVKAWDAANENEPANWDVVVQENEHDLQSGALLFVVHHGDVTFGNISVTPIAD